ncbi:MAG: glycosyltransferase family 2 protein [Methanobacterium sp.]|uniref:glycosyltransferase family 2 protein n=2 Tax=Methanobacterium sp. TaxID=2164 RepID=UPI003C76E79A
MMVSIIIPTYNRANYLTKAIDSALSQDYPNIEVIVSDNASSDDTGEMVKKYKDDNRFKYFRNNHNLGMVANWRKALNNYATGDFFMILSDDDYLIDDNYISKVVKLVESDPEIVIVYGNGYLFYEKSNKMVEFILPFNRVENGKTIFLSRSKVLPQDFCLCNVLFKRNLALKLNAFSNDNNITCDSELFLKMCLYGKVGIIQDLVSVYQIHSQNLILRLKSDLKLIINNYDHLSEPYKLAKKSNIFQKGELEEWEDRVIVPYMFYILFTVMVSNPENYEKLARALKEKDPVVLMKVQKTSRFKLVLLLHKLRLLPIIYKFKNIDLINKVGTKIFQNSS